jgi:hypothetical protein
MSVIPTVSQDGVGVVAAGQLNAYALSCYNTGVLRSVVGQTGMTAYLQGTNVPGDGGQGTFYWNYASTAADDNSAVIVPAGVVYGAWIRLALSVSSGGTGTTTSTGTGSVVLNNSPTLISPSISGATFTSGTTGTGNIVLATSPTITTPTLATPTITGALTLTSAFSAPTVNSTAAITVNSKQAVNGPAVSAYLSSNQTLTSGTGTKVALNTINFDTDSTFNTLSTNRFTPTVAGYYQCSATIGATATGGTQASSQFYKNGGIYINGSGAKQAFTEIYMSVSAVVFFNGTTDYLELWGSVTGTTPVFVGGQIITAFSASMVRGQ